MNETHEVERIAELEAQGYVEGDQICPECGATLMGLGRTFIIDNDTDLEEISRECPYCGFTDVQYDD